MKSGLIRCDQVVVDIGFAGIHFNQFDLTFLALGPGDAHAQYAIAAAILETLHGGAVDFIDEEGTNTDHVSPIIDGLLHIWHMPGVLKRVSRYGQWRHGEAPL